ncbi:MAG: serine/threonine protein kinase, partial [Myxococcales bacterium]|nr:serine/threonine protein kinase [Myxococcales bacterium]
MSAIAGTPVSPGTVFIDRYEVQDEIGRGGMGEVRRVYDALLDRTVAMKVLGLPILDNPIARARFAREAGITAGLQHPGIVPVHDRGELPDGRLWYTMREVLGRTLADVIADVHRVSGDHAWRDTPDGWNLRRLIETLLRVCEAMAYAHREGIVHRDLKPQNVMVGAFGEVQVMDWGLARLMQVFDHEGTYGELDDSSFSRSFISIETPERNP